MRADRGNRYSRYLLDLSPTLETMEKTNEIFNIYFKKLLNNELSKLETIIWCLKEDNMCLRRIKENQESKIKELEEKLSVKSDEEQDVQIILQKRAETVKERSPAPLERKVQQQENEGEKAKQKTEAASGDSGATTASSAKKPSSGGARPKVGVKESAGKQVRPAVNPSPAPRSAARSTTGRPGVPAATSRPSTTSTTTTAGQTDSAPSADRSKDTEDTKSSKSGSMTGSERNSKRPAASMEDLPGPSGQKKKRRLTCLPPPPPPSRLTCFPPPHFCLADELVIVNQYQRHVIKDRDAEIKALKDDLVLIGSVLRIS